jgi:hypothetical protein
MTPAWTKGEVVFGCSTCGAVLKENGDIFLNEDDLKDIFRANTLIDNIMPDVKELPPGLSAVLYSRIVEFGTHMWLDGLKQGLLYGEVRRAKGDLTPGPKR